MRYIGIIILLALCLTLLFLTNCQLDTVRPESAGPTVYPQKWATGTGTVSDPWTNSCIESAYAACPTGGTIYLKAGYYQLADYLSIAKSINIIGEGRDKTIIITADAPGLHINNTDYCTIKNLTVDGAAQTTGSYVYCIGVGFSDYSILENIEVKNAYTIGIDANSNNHSLFQNIYTHDNGSHGIHPGTNTSGRNMYNTYRNIYTWDNAGSGFDDVGNQVYVNEDLYNVYDNMNCWDNGKAGMSIFQQRNGVISNSSASGNGSLGFNLWGLENFNIHDCSATLNMCEGICLRESDNVNLTNVIVKNNANDSEWRGGIDINASNGTRFTSCQSYDDRNTPLQKYGLKTEGNVDYIELVNCKLSPNLSGAIYNGAYPLAVIIEEIKLASL